MIKQGHPKGLYFLFTIEMWERFSYYGMRALLVLYMVKVLLFSTEKAGYIYGMYTGLVYLTPLIGGYMADRYLGQKPSIIIGAVLMMLGHFAIAVPHMSFFYAALALLIVGNGFFKPNISTIVGQLYEENDPRRDGGFTIFYMRINLGAFFSPLICGTLGEKVGFHYGFASAGVGMLIGLLIFMWGQNKYIKHVGNNSLRKEITVNNQEISPVDPAIEQIKPVELIEEAAVATLEKVNEQVEIEEVKETKFIVKNKDLPLTKEEKQQVAVIFIMMFFCIFFWASFEQAGSSMTLFADRSTDRMLPFLNWEFPVSYFQAVNPLLIMLLAPIFSRLWLDLAFYKKNPSMPIKFAIGLFLIAVGFIIMAGAANLAGAGKVSFLWLMIVYLFHTLGELCISPVGLSMVTKLAPIKFASLLMAIWFLSSFFANLAAGFFAGCYDSLRISEFFLIPALITGVACISILVLSKPIKKWMNGVE